MSERTNSAYVNISSGEKIKQQVQMRNTNRQISTTADKKLAIKPPKSPVRIKLPLPATQEKGYDKEAKV
jgi:hypothetical protein